MKALLAILLFISFSCFADNYPSKKYYKTIVKHQKHNGTRAHRKHKEAQKKWLKKFNRQGR